MDRSDVDFHALFEGAQSLLLVLDPSLYIVGATDAYLESTMAAREDAVGQHLFVVFPDNPDDHEADGVSNLRASLERVIRTLEQDVMPIQKYDVRASDGSGFEERFWSCSNRPVLGSDGQLRYIIHRAEDVTDFVRMKQADAEQEREVFARSREVAAASRRLKEDNAELLKLAQDGMGMVRDQIGRQLNEKAILRMFDISVALSSAKSMASPAVSDRLDTAILALDSILADIRTTVFGSVDSEHEMSHG